jgi:hypothetical protein
MSHRDLPIGENHSDQLLQMAMVDRRRVWVNTFQKQPI